MATNSLASSRDLKLLGVIRPIAIALLVLAVVFRFAHLDRKVYWHDEVYTSAVITARPGNYLTEGLFQNKVVKPADLLAYQQFVPDLTLTDMVVRKGLEDVQHPPLYYVLLRFWAQMWGTTPTVARGFSSFLSLLLFPAVYWLCLELFESRLSGWIAIALLAVSPFHLVFGQEARQFGFWTALIFASGALLLRAIRFSSWRNWAWYGVSMVVASYTALFTLWIGVGHFIYVLFIDEESRLFKLPLRIGKRTISCIVTLLVVALLFTPWVYFIISSRNSLNATTGWLAVPLPLLINVQSTIANFSRSFVDFNLDANSVVGYVLAIPILSIQAYAAVVLCRTAPYRIWWFIFTLVGVTALVLLLPDLLFGGQRFTVTRYLFPCVVGLQLAVVHWMTSYFTDTRKWRFWLATAVFSLLILLGISSCGVYIQANTWWNKVLNSNYHQVADLINSSDRPLIIADGFGYYPASMVSLSYLLKPDTQLLLLPPVGNSFPIEELPANAKTIFLFNLPEAFRRQFESRFRKKLTFTFQDPWNEVWKNTTP